jgi:tRNA modification GTPase
VLVVLDASQQINEEDAEIIERTAGRPVIVVLNKADLAPSLSNISIDAPTVATSASTGKGIDALEDEIAKLVLGGKISSGEGTVVTNARHRLALQSAKESLSHVIETINEGLPIDFLSTDLMAARSSLGEITGETASEDLIDRIFSDFCIGK